VADPEVTQFGCYFWIAGDSTATSTLVMHNGSDRYGAGQVKQISKVELRRLATRDASKSLLEQMVAGEIEVYIGYRRLYRYWCSHNSAVEELRPMFSIPNLSPDGILSVTDDFNEQIISIAHEILTSFRN
jgi:hypothetical protein